MAYINIALTLIMFTIFIGIVIWAWSPARKKQFDEAAQLALEPDDIIPPAAAKQEQREDG